MEQARANERVQRGIFRVEVLLERAQHLAESMRRRRDVHGVARATATDPVLAAPDLARRLFGSPHTAHQALVGSIEQPHRERQPARVRELFARIHERVEVVADLFDVGSR